MARHAKNNCSAPVFSHYEKSRLQYGTQKMVLSSESFKDVDHCCLCLQAVGLPAVCCGEGHLFCKECVLQSLVEQRKECKRKLELWEAQNAQQLADEQRARDQQNEAVLETMKRMDSGINAAGPPGSEKKPGLGCFWVPSLTPDAVKDKAEKPSQRTMCPGGEAGGTKPHALRAKDLIALQFTEAPEGGEVKSHKRSGGGERARFQCPICLRAITNTRRVALPRTCGHVCCEQCILDLVALESKKKRQEEEEEEKPQAEGESAPAEQKEDAKEGEKDVRDKKEEKEREKAVQAPAVVRCYVCNAAFNPARDIVVLQAGATGYSGHGDKLKIEVFTPAARV
eukprot:m51a1_g13502 hypothetical protein (340) ;mRNA; f:821-1939